jgi:hypothetical protein
MFFLLGEVSFLAKDLIFFLNYDIVDLAKRFSNRNTLEKYWSPRGLHVQWFWGFRNN